MSRKSVGETMSFYVDLEVDEAAKLVSERLGVRLEGRTDRCGEREYNGCDAQGAWLWLRETPSVELPGESRRREPEPSWLWVWGTVLGEEIRTALAAFPFRLGSVGPGPTRNGLDRETSWHRVLAGLRADGWRIELNGSGDGLIQTAGTLPTGEEFYSNFKYECTYLQVGEGDDFWWTERPYPRAGYMDPDEAGRVLRELHGFWLAR